MMTSVWVLKIQEVVQNLGLDAHQHRLFLTKIYYSSKILSCGRSKRRNVLCTTPETGGLAEITGKCASLLGLEAAIAKNNPEDP